MDPNLFLKIKKNTLRKSAAVEISRFQKISKKNNGEITE
jgi:hypothetical protein